MKAIKRGSCAVVAAFCVPRVVVDDVADAVGDATLLIDDARFGSDTPAQIRLAARPLVGAPLVLVGFGSGCVRVLQLWKAGACPSGVVLVDGLTAAMPPKEWEINHWSAMINAARCDSITLHASHTPDRSVERGDKWLRQTSAVSMLRQLTGWPLSQMGTTRDGSLYVLTHDGKRSVLADLVRATMKGIHAFNR